MLEKIGKQDKKKKGMSKEITIDFLQQKGL